MYYFWANDAQAGPYTLNQVRAMWNSGQINPTTLYYREGMQTWGSMAEIVHIIENTTPVREAPRILETRKPQDKLSLSAIPVAAALQWLSYATFALAIITFFLPNVSVTVPLFGNQGMSMLDLVTSKPSNSTNKSSFPGERSSHRTQAPNLWDDIADDKAGLGGIICVVSLFLLMGHYALALIWGFLAFALRRTYDFLTFFWLCLAVQFPILFLIGGQILISGMKSKMAEDTGNNPFAAFGQAMMGSVSLQPGLVTWFLMVLSLGALILLFIKRKHSLG